MQHTKGVDLATRFFPTLESFTFAVRDKVQEIRELRKVKATLIPEVDAGAILHQLLTP